LALRGLHVRAIVGFDTIIPRSALSVAPPSLIFAVAVKPAIGG
jgi:hypothetical protein